MAITWKHLLALGAVVAASGTLLAISTGPDDPLDAARADDAGGATPGPTIDPVVAEEQLAGSEASAVGADDAAQPDAEPEPDYTDHMSVRGQQARGLYYTAQFLRRHGAEGVQRSVERARLDAAVIDLKDAQGRVGHQTDIEILKDQEGSGYLGDDPAGFIGHLNDAGIYTIARITCFADPQLPKRHPEHAIQDARPRHRGEAWVSWGTGHTWLDPYDPFNHQLVIDLAKEAEALGFDEIQLDYVRFPVDDGTEYAIYPHETDQPRDQLLLGLLRRIDAAVKIPLGVDVFGLTAFRDGDPPELGQHLEAWREHVDVYSPMLYMNSMTAWRAGERNRDLLLILEGISTMRRRLGDGPVIRPFLQAFRAGADSWDPPFIARQIRGAKMGGADGFLFWNTASNYTMVRRAMGGAAHGLSPFDVAPRADARTHLAP